MHADMADCIDKGKKKILYKSRDSTEDNAPDYLSLGAGGSIWPMCWWDVMPDLTHSLTSFQLDALASRNHSLFSISEYFPRPQYSYKLLLPAWSSISEHPSDKMIKHD